MITRPRHLLDDAHPPSPAQQIGDAAETLIAQRTTRTRFIDRIAMRVGLALLIWSTGRHTARAGAGRGVAHLSARLAERERDAHQLLRRAVLGGTLGR